MLLSQFKKSVERYRLLEKDDRLIVGVSGGVDSMVLLHLLYACRQELSLFPIVAHVNHGLRPEESEEEAKLVRRESGRLGLPFEYGQFDVKEFSKTRGLSLQDGGRRIRFHFFSTLLSKHGAQKIALGHNADDQVETILLRLLRGSGLKGLKGMLPIREGRFIRPLLETWRSAIESFAKENGIPYLLDSSNLKRDYLRNRLRLDLIPLIEKEYQPNFKEMMMKTSAILRDEDDFLEEKAKEAYQKVVEEKDGFCFRLSEFQRLHRAIQWRVIQRILGRVCSDEVVMEGGRWSAVDSVYKRLVRPSPSFLFELPYGILLEKRYDTVSLGKGRVKPIPPFEVELIAPGRTIVKEIGKEVVIEEILRDVEIEELKGTPNIALLDYQSLQLPLKMRNFRPGDRFKPLGLKGTQKLKEFFIDHKIPRFERAKIPLLVSGETVVWVVGYRVSERAKITAKTEKILKVKVE